MKKLFVFLLIASLFLMGYATVNAAVSKTVTTVKVNNTHTTTTNEVRNFVKGRTIVSMNMSPSWAISGAALTSSELSFVKSVILSNWDDVYIDLTNNTYTTDLPSSYSTTTITGEETKVTYEEDASDPLNIIMTETTDTFVNVNNVSSNVTTTVTYDIDPIILDLNDDKKIDVAENQWRPHGPIFYRDYAKMFDVDGDGQQDLIEWMKPFPSDGILVMPKDGKVESILQLFGNAGGYKDGFEKLSITCDKDKNGWIEGKELEGLAIWIDANNNAVCEETEIKSLDEYNITKIKATHKDWVSQYVTKDGKNHMCWNWWPTGVEARRLRNR